MNNTNELKENKKNRLRIISNPYTREIQYDYWDYRTDEWTAPANTSEFKNEKFTKSAIYHKAYDIIETALKSYGGNVGLDIYFEGTADDFRCLNEIADTYFNDKEINLIKDDNELLSVAAVKKGIKSAFQDIEDMFNKYPNNSATEKIKKFNDAMSNTIPICVMGLYSTGKSAFINSLLGVEILPSADAPTTAKTFRISVGPEISEYTISFDYQDESTPKTNIKLTFCNGKFDINTTMNHDGIISMLDEEVNKYNTEYDKMYHALSVINEYDKNYKPAESSEIQWRVSPFIEVTLPLKKSYTSLPIDKHNFVIYDTPGSNSASNIDHNKIMKNAMKEQTNGLPIYVITSKNIDSDSNTELIKTLNELGDSLDRNNLMIIVNQADDPGRKDLVDLKKNYDSLAVHRLNPAGIYFVSAIMGLSSKMLMTKRSDRTEVEDGDTGEMKIIEKPCFIDSHYWELFKKNKPDFVSRLNPKKLYSYNIIPVPEFENYTDNVNLDSSPNERIFYNSGLDAIGSAIAGFSENYSLYNKCRNAGGYLSEALELITEEIEAKKQESEELCKNFDKELSDTEKNLLNELDNLIYRKNTVYRWELEKELSSIVDERYECLTKDVFMSLDIDLLEIWFGYSSERKEYMKKIESDLKISLKIGNDRLQEAATKKLETYFNDIMKECVKITYNIPTCSYDFKNILNSLSEIMSIPCVKEINISPNEVAKGFIFKKLDRKSLDSKLHDIFYRESNKAINSLINSWNKLKFQMNPTLRTCMKSNNPRMQEIQTKIKSYQEAIEDFINQKESIIKKITEINELTEFKPVDESEE